MVQQQSGNDRHRSVNLRSDQKNLSNLNNTENRLKKNDQRLREIWGNNKKSGICMMESQQERREWAERTVEEIVFENFPNLV